MMWRLVLLAGIIYLLLKWLRRGAPPAKRPPTADPAPGHPIEEMVKDPACGTWIPASQALAVEQGRETLHFCSADCRDKFLSELRGK